MDEIKKVTGMQSQKVKNILRRMFSKGKHTKYKFVALENADFYAFIINNVQHLKMDFKEVTSGLGGVQMSLKLEPKTTTFTIPEMEIYKYSEVKKRTVFRLNAYKEYTNEFIVGKLRSEPERLFERYCENNKNVQWFYKNGDAGQQYLSIVYIDGVGKQWLFYPDYVVHMKDGTDWIIETKGGEVAGHSKNIDMQVVNKFHAFKNYAEKYHLKWGVVRDESEDLFINNTEYIEDMADEHWVDISLENIIIEALLKDCIATENEQKLVLDGREYLFNQRIHQEEGNTQCYVEISSQGRIRDAIYVLTYLDNIICRSEMVKYYQVITDYDGLSQYYCEKLYPKYATFERMLRSILYIILIKAYGLSWYDEVVKKERFENGKKEDINAAVKETAKGKSMQKLISTALEEMDLDTMRKFLFLPYRRITPDNVIDTLVNSDFDSITKEQIYEKLNLASEHTLGRECLSQIGNEQTWNDNINSIRISRNIVAHSKTLTFEKYEEYRKEINKRNRELKNLLTELQEEKFKQEQKKELASSINNLFTVVGSIFGSGELKKAVANLQANLKNIGDKLSASISPSIANGFVSESIRESSREMVETFNQQMKSLHSPEMMEVMRLSMSETLRRMTEAYSHMYLDMSNLNDNTASDEEDECDDDNEN